ncbi:MAG: cytidine deaminase [Gemmatimonadetes bacterium]|nr:cytidine deaminase [Gemmatimonadota bacterium]
MKAAACVCVRSVYIPPDPSIDPPYRKRKSALSSSASTIDPAVARDLLARARQARANAYAPYSRFPVGAALLAADGRVFTGCNVENASYGLGNCAERVAIGKAVSEGAREFAAIAVTGPEDGTACAPCGACRQVLSEFGPDLPVVTPSGNAEGYQLTSMGQLLPGAFGPAALAASQRDR